jgi:cytochrome c-type biogenesis protein CcmH
MNPRIGLAFLALLLAFSGLNAQESNVQTENRIRQLEEKLRCLVCQNQTLADSSAELAGDLRREVREQVKAGRSDDEIIQFLVQRYGDFVRYEPPFKASTALLWLGPFVLLAGAAAFLLLALRRRRNAPEEPALAPDEKRLVERVLGPAPKEERADGPGNGAGR